MTNPTPHGQVPEALIDLIDAYAETRHRCGGIYNAKTEAARKAVIEALSGVQALSAAPAGLLNAARMAMDALDWHATSDKTIPLWKRQQPALEALRAALAEQQAITPETGNSVSAQGAAITSESGAVYAELPELTSTEINDACWAFVGAMPHNLPGPFWNDLKPAVYAAICKFLQAAPKAAPGEREQAAQRLRELAGIPQEDVADPLHPRYIEGYKAGHAAGRKRAAPQQEAQEPSRAAKTWCSYVAGMIGCYLNEPDESTKVQAIAGIIERRLWALPTPQPAPAPLSDDVVKDAARWRMVALIGYEVMLHPEKRTQAAAVKAYMDATHSGSDLTGAVDAALAAQGDTP